MLCSANLQDQAIFAMCSLKVSWSLKITPRLRTEHDGVIVEEPSWMVKSCCRVGVAGKTRSSVFLHYLVYLLSCLFSLISSVLLVTPRCSCVSALPCPALMSTLKTASFELYPHAHVPRLCTVTIFG